MTLHEAIAHLEFLYENTATEAENLVKDFRRSITATEPHGDATLRALVTAARDDQMALAIAIEAMHTFAYEHPLAGEPPTRA